jgi:hypothetical protein
MVPQEEAQANEDAPRQRGMGAGNADEMGVPQTPGSRIPALASGWLNDVTFLFVRDHEISVFTNLDRHLPRFGNRFLQNFDVLFKAETC